MNGRVALVIGSQCRGLGNLSFLPSVAESLYAALTDPLVGGCEPALPGGSGLILDPSQAVMKQSIRDAFARANETDSTLFLAFVGHGQVGFDGPGAVGFSDFYLLPADCADPSRPSGDNAWLVGQSLRELLRDHDQIDGLVTLLDACQSGQGAVEVAHRVASVAMAAGARFELVTATDDRPAADGCFSRKLTALLRAGHPGRGERLYSRDARDLISCRGQAPQWLGFDGRRLADEGDPGLWLAPNWQRTSGRVPPDGSRAAAMTTELTAHLEAPALLEGLAARTRRARWVAIVGPAGAGKSTLLSALGRRAPPQVTSPIGSSIRLILAYQPGKARLRLTRCHTTNRVNTPRAAPRTSVGGYQTTFRILPIAGPERPDGPLAIPVTRSQQAHELISQNCGPTCTRSSPAAETGWISYEAEENSNSRFSNDRKLRIQPE